MGASEGKTNLAGAREMNDIEDDVQYYQRRAEEEVARAQQAADPRTVSLHYELAELFLERVSEIKGRQGCGNRPEPPTAK